MFGNQFVDDEQQIGRILQKNGAKVFPSAPLKKLVLINKVLIHEIKDVLNCLEQTNLFTGKFLAKFVIHQDNER